MVQPKKTFNKVLTISAIGFGAYALLKGLSNGLSASNSGEGSLGGNEDMIGQEGLYDDNITPSIIQPYVPDVIINDQPINNDPVIDNSNQINPNSPTPNDLVSANNSNYSTPSAEPTSLFGDLSTPTAIALGAASLLPSAASSLGKLAVSKSDDVGFSIFKKVIPDAVEETPFFGKQLKDFVFKKSDDAVVGVARYGVKNLGSEIVETGAKSFLKKGLVNTGGILVKSIPFVGIGAGVTFDIATTPEYKAQYDAGGLSKYGILGVSTFANALGDVVGGAAAVVTSPAALTGVGAVVPVAASVAGQVATESVVYKIYNMFTGNKNTNNNVNPVIGSGQSFSMSDSSKDKVSLSDQYVDDDDYIDYSRFKSDGAGGFLDTLKKQSVSKSVASSRSGSNNLNNFFSAPTIKSSGSSNGSRSSNVSTNPAMASVGAVGQYSYKNKSTGRIDTLTGKSSSSKSRSGSSSSSRSGSSSSKKKKTTKKSYGRKVSSYKKGKYHSG